MTHMDTGKPLGSEDAPLPFHNPVKKTYLISVKRNHHAG